MLGIFRGGAGLLSQLRVARIENRIQSQHDLDQRTLPHMIVKGFLDGAFLLGRKGSLGRVEIAEDISEAGPGRGAGWRLPALKHPDDQSLRFDHHPVRVRQDRTPQLSASMTLAVAAR